MSATCDILIRSYYKDFDWLELCVRAIRKYCSGFRDVVLVVPESSRERLMKRSIAVDRTFYCRDYADDYLGQQVTKLLADTFSDADFVSHVDSDSMFVRPTAASELFDADRCHIHMTRYDRLTRRWWQTTTERFLCQPVAFDFMRRQPQTYPRWLYAELREFAQRVHHVELSEYVLAQPRQGFSEFNALGAYAHHYHRDRFVWLEDSECAPHCKSYWSWGGVAAARSEIVARLAADDLGSMTTRTN